MRFLLLLVFLLASSGLLASPGDMDTDGVPDGLDCRPADSTAWYVPTEARSLTIAGAALNWSAPSNPGGTQVILYDVIRSTSASDFSAATCVISNATTLNASDSSTPSNVYFYLVRSKDLCGDNLGTDSAGNPRTGISCLKNSGDACTYDAEC